MKTKFTCILTLLLCAVFFLPISANADVIYREITPPVIDDITDPFNPILITPGTGQLEISSDNVADWETLVTGPLGAPLPPFWEASWVTRLFIEDGVETIPPGAFSATSIEWVMINASAPALTIQIGAFQNVSTITEIYLWTSALTTIGDDAFRGLPNLTTLSMVGASNLTGIGSSAFRGSGLAAINFDGATSLTHIGNEAFRESSNLTSVTFLSAGALTHIGDGAFASAPNLLSIDMTDAGALTEIGNNAFDGATRLQTLLFPVPNAGVNTTIGQFAFASAGNANLSAPTLDVTIPASVTEIGLSAFLNSGIRILNLQTANPRALTIGASAFQGSSLESLTLPPNATNVTIGVSAFEGTTRLESLNVLNNVTLIDDRAFHSSGMTVVDMINATRLAEIRQYAFAECANIHTLTFPPTTTVPGGLIIGLRAFAGGTNIASHTDGQLTIPPSIRDIGSWAFDRCTSITALGVNMTAPPAPNAERWIRENAFSGTANLESVIIAQPGGPLNIQYSAFRGLTRLNVLTFPDAGVVRIGPFAFAETGEDADLNVTIPSSVTVLSENAFRGSFLTRLNLGTAIGLTEIGNHAFRNCIRLTGAPNADSPLIIPNFVHTIGDFAFNDTPSLMGLVLPSFGALHTIGANSFEGSGLIGSLSIPPTVETIRGFAFNGVGITTLTIPQGNRNPDPGLFIGESAFRGTSIRNFPFEIPPRVREIDSSAFRDCTDLTTLILPNSPLIIGPSAFENINISTLRIPPLVQSIGNNAFLNNPRLSLVHFDKPAPIPPAFLGDFVFSNNMGPWLTVIVPDNASLEPYRALMGPWATFPLGTRFLVQDGGGVEIVDRITLTDLDFIQRGILRMHVPQNIVTRPDGSIVIPVGGVPAIIETRSGLALEIPPGSELTHDGRIILPPGAARAVTVLTPIPVAGRRAEVSISGGDIRINEFGEIVLSSAGNITITTSNNSAVIVLSNGKIVLRGEAVTSGVQATSARNMDIIVGSGGATISYANGNRDSVAEGESIIIDGFGNAVVAEASDQDESNGDGGGCNIQGLGAAFILLVLPLLIKKRRRL